MASKKTKARSSRKPRKQAPKSLPAATLEVLTLAEAAAYLRVTEEEVVRLVGPHGMPGRCIGDEWRFLKSALQVWLATPPKSSSKEALLSQAGAFEDDAEDLAELRAAIYRDRGRSEVEEGP